MNLLSLDVRVGWRRFAPLAVFTWLVGCGAASSNEPATVGSAGSQSSQSSAPETLGAAAPAEVSAVEITPNAHALDVVAQPDRTEEDREKDALRLPAHFLTFAGVRPGMRVADMGAGSGYTTELLRRAVGSEGLVFSHNTNEWNQGDGARAWAERLSREGLEGVVQVVRELDDPLPPEASDLDLVAMLFFFHDAIAAGADVQKMVERIHAHLRPGGHFVILDHSAAPDSGEEAATEFHRMDQALLTEIVTSAGFVLAAEASNWRKPEDTRDWLVWERDFQTDRFALRFVKPEAAQ
jgi:predicted methyltransferase